MQASDASEIQQNNIRRSEVGCNFKAKKKSVFFFVEKFSFVFIFQSKKSKEIWKFLEANDLRFVFDMWRWFVADVIADVDADVDLISGFLFVGPVFVFGGEIFR